MVLCRLDDGAIFVAHPLMFQPFVEAKLGVEYDEGSPTRSRDVLTMAETMSMEDFKAINATIAQAAVRPEPLDTFLAKCGLPGRAKEAS